MPENSLRLAPVRYFSCHFRVVCQVIFALEWLLKGIGYVTQHTKDIVLLPVHGMVPLNGYQTVPLYS